MGLSRVSLPHRKATVGPHSLVTLVHMAGPPPCPPCSVLRQESPGAPSESCPLSPLILHPSHSGAVLPLKLPSLGRGARNLDIPAATNLIFLPLNNWLVHCREHLVMSGGSGLESGPELALGPGVGSGQARGRRARRIGKAVGRVLRRAEPPLAARLGLPGSQEGKQDMAILCCHPLPTGRIPHLNGT